jgi:hypothetical protein
VQPEHDDDWAAEKDPKKHFNDMNWCITSRMPKKIPAGQMVQERSPGPLKKPAGQELHNAETRGSC